jgi:hypothetical protein
VKYERGGRGFGVTWQQDCTFVKGRFLDRMNRMIRMKNRRTECASHIEVKAVGALRDEFRIRNSEERWNYQRTSAFIGG